MRILGRAGVGVRQSTFLFFALTGRSGALKKKSVSLWPTTPSPARGESGNRPPGLFGSSLSRRYVGGRQAIIWRPRFSVSSGAVFGNFHIRPALRKDLARKTAPQRPPAITTSVGNIPTSARSFAAQLASNPPGALWRVAAFDFAHVGGANG